MRKVTEDTIALELSGLIECRLDWDGRRIIIDDIVETDDNYYNIDGTIDYTYNYEESTNSLYMTWVDVYIDSITMTAKDDDTPLPCHVNKHFVEKYLEQYLMSL